MKAIHSLWTRPFFVRGGRDFFMEDFEILTMILSALVWRRGGGSIKMVTDDEGAKYFSSRKLEKLWDGGIETPLNGVPETVDPFLFWAGGKLLALNSQPEPVCMIDTDMIVWRECDSIAELDIVAAHREDIMLDVYPDKEYFRMKPEYTFPDWDWNIQPCNTAFLYIKDLEFREYYVERSFEFMENLREDSNVVIPMVFAEQRLLSMCAKERGKEIYTLLQLGNLKNQGDVTHVWGHKNSLRADPKVRADYCRRCIERIRRDFSEYGGMLESVPEIFNHLWSM
ncbi:MAG: DUF6734 family protein [Clostridia bacterium]